MAKFEECEYSENYLLHCPFYKQNVELKMMQFIFKDDLKKLINWTNLVTQNHLKFI